MHDNTVGDTIAGSTGNPTNYCATAMLFLGVSTGGYFNLHDLRILHAYRAVYATAKVKVDISNCQIVHADTAFRNSGSFWNLRNVLVSDVLTAFVGDTPLTNNAEHITFHTVSNFVATGLPPIVFGMRVEAARELGAGDRDTRWVRAEKGWRAGTAA